MLYTRQKTALRSSTNCSNTLCVCNRVATSPLPRFLGKGRHYARCISNSVRIDVVRSRLCFIYSNHAHFSNNIVLFKNMHDVVSHKFYIIICEFRICISKDIIAVITVCVVLLRSASLSTSIVFFIVFEKAFFKK